MAAKKGIALKKGKKLAGTKTLSGGKLGQMNTTRNLGQMNTLSAVHSLRKA